MKCKCITCKPHPKKYINELMSELIDILDEIWYDKKVKLGFFEDTVKSFPKKNSKATIKTCPCGNNFRAYKEDKKNKYKFCSTKCYGENKKKYSGIKLEK